MPDIGPNNVFHFNPFIKSKESESEGGVCHWFTYLQLIDNMEHVGCIGYQCVSEVQFKVLVVISTWCGAKLPEGPPFSKGALPIQFDLAGCRSH